MHHNFKLVANMRSLFINETLYKRKVRKLIYLTHIRLNISIIVNITSRFLSPPQEAHNMAVIDQILWYVKRMINYGLCLQRVRDCTFRRYMWTLIGQEMVIIEGQCQDFSFTQVHHQYLVVQKDNLLLQLHRQKLNTRHFLKIKREVYVASFFAVRTWFLKGYIHNQRNHLVQGPNDLKRLGFITFET